MTPKLAAFFVIIGLALGSSLALANPPQSDSGSYGGVSYQGSTSVPSSSGYSGTLTQHQGQGVVTTFLATHCPWNPAAGQYQCTGSPVGGWMTYWWTHNTSFWTPRAYGYSQINCCGGSSPSLETYDEL